MSTVWTDERVKLLRQLWRTELTCSQIATRLGHGISRNAVIGKKNRLGLPDRVCDGRKNPRRGKSGWQKAMDRQRRAREAASMAKAGEGSAGARTALGDHPGPATAYSFGRGPASKVPLAPTPLPATEELDIPVAERKTLHDLEDHHCRWPIGEVRSADFHFCGRERVKVEKPDGSASYLFAYCEFHARKAFQPPKVSRPILSGLAGIDTDVCVVKAKEIESV